MSTKIICIANPNGGVGKTAIAAYLAHSLSDKGGRVLLIDPHPQGQSAIALGHSPEPGVFYLLTMGMSQQETNFINFWVFCSGREGLHILPGDQQTMAAQTVLNAQDKPVSAVRQTVSRFFKEGPYILFDTAPSVGGTLREERTVWASDLVIVPTATEFLSADGVGKVLGTMSILPTFYDEQTCESKATIEDLEQRFASSLLPPIHCSTLLREWAARGQTIFEMNELCRAAREFQALAQIVLKY